MSTSLDRRSFVTCSAATVTSMLAGWGAHAQTSTPRLKLGLISAATYAANYANQNQPRTMGSHHGTAFASTFNGFDAEKLKSWKGTFVKAEMRIETASVVKVWDPDQNAAKLLADICNIPEVSASAEACCEGVDAVLVVDDGSGEQWKYALHALRKGIPTFCDKPLAMNSKDALEVARVVRETKTPFMSASSLRFVPDIVKLRDELPQLGKVHLATVACGSDLIYYGMHALSMAYAVLGKGCTSATNVGKPGLNLARLRFGESHDVMVMVGDREVMRGGFQISLYGQKGWRTVTPDLKNLYTYLLQAFFEQLNSGKEAVPVEEEVELIAALEAAALSLKEGREVMLSELLQPGA